MKDVGRAKNSKVCKHDVLQLTSSPFAELAGFQPFDARARIAATTRSGRAPPERNISTINTQLVKQDETESQDFPAPLVLPHDALNYDPDGDEPAQSFKSWLNEKHRNKITPERKTIYVGAPPEINEKVAFMREWTKPSAIPESNDRPSKRVKKTEANKNTQTHEMQLSPPTVDDSIAYLSRFYHGIPVKRLPINLRWVAWEQSKSRTVPTVNGIPKYVALDYGKGATRVRARPCPDGVFPAQLNLDDILDAAIAMLPADAYTVVLLVDHDIYESPDDDFCAGRAYGGSRVSVVQSARYNPLLDEKFGIVRKHAWPMSHCRCVVEEICGAEEDVEISPATKVEINLSRRGAMRSAVDAVARMEVGETCGEMEALWASRVLRTMSHELGHCLCLAHCRYYACIMQSTSSLIEDTRQPPSLCPVCLTKISHTVSADLHRRESPQEQKRWKYDRYTALLEYCTEKRKETRDTILWVGLEAWLSSVLGEREWLMEKSMDVVDLTADES